jgi:hypothetical protein
MPQCIEEVWDVWSSNLLANRPIEQSLGPVTMYQWIFEGGWSMKLERYLLLVLVVFGLIVLGTFLHKMGF